MELASEDRNRFGDRGVGYYITSHACFQVYNSTHTLEDGKAYLHLQANREGLNLTDQLYDLSSYKNVSD